MLLKSCDNKKTHFKPITKRLTKNIPNNQKIQNTKYLYSKVITNKYKHIAQILPTYTKPTHSQYQKYLKLHLKLIHKYKTKNNNLIVKNIGIRIIITPHQPCVK
jgi:ATP phosphoribosyltransferase